MGLFARYKTKGGEACFSLAILLENEQHIKYEGLMGKPVGEECILEKSLGPSIGIVFTISNHNLERFFSFFRMTSDRGMPVCYRDLWYVVIRYQAPPCKTASHMLGERVKLLTSTKETDWMAAPRLSFSCFFISPIIKKTIFARTHKLFQISFRNLETQS